jgi:hypothetical protein
VLEFLNNGLTDPRVAQEIFPFDRPTLDSERPRDPNLDVIPDDTVNELDPDSDDTVLVAIFGADNFAADKVNLSTVRLGPNLAPYNGSHFVTDRNSDPYLDMSIEFDMPDIGISCDDTYLEITGETYSGTPFIGQDSITTIGSDCEDDGCHP